MTCPACQQRDPARVSVYHPIPPEIDMRVEGADRVCAHRFHANPATLEAYRAALRAGDMDEAERIEKDLSR